MSGLSGIRYYDTSALLPLYLEEPVTEAAQEALTRDFGQLVTSVLALVEVQATLARHQREGSLNAAQSEAVMARLSHDLDGAPRRLELGEAVLDEAIRLLRVQLSPPLRTLDALHIASCLDYGTRGFVTADRQQAQFARALGLEVALLRPYS